MSYINLMSMKEIIQRQAKARQTVEVEEHIQYNI